MGSPSVEQGAATLALFALRKRTCGPGRRRDAAKFLYDCVHSPISNSRATPEFRSIGGLRPVELK
jgi:hypothetical protein